jgi:hypothetical protein
VDAPGNPLVDFEFVADQRSEFLYLLASDRRAAGETYLNRFWMWSLIQCASHHSTGFTSTPPTCMEKCR